MNFLLVAVAHYRRRQLYFLVYLLKALGAIKRRVIVRSSRCVAIALNAVLIIKLIIQSAAAAAAIKLEPA